MEGILQKKIFKIGRNYAFEQDDYIALEEPMELRIGFGAINDRQQKSISITMRTPGNDVELALGFLLTEGLLSSINEGKGQLYAPILKIGYVSSQHEDSKKNIVKVELPPDLKIDLKKLERHFYTSSSCGVCGKASIEAVYQSNFPDLVEHSSVLKKEILFDLPKILRKHQSVFENTGGLHAAALFDFNGNLIKLHEDIGRHNAVDKLIGWAYQEKMLPLSNFIILVSGRAGFELIQKSLMAGIPIMAAVGAPSSLAMQLAEEAGMTLIGFLKSEGFNLYCNSDRLKI